ncbi:hypothetical protein ADL22_29125 [Streptomyces sp. NRRL F-4489]|uniref:hypothetical protein n=1 Tax=Streptomyces sp. NRRL F-4489 TaxID=1609095 RepID=UPI00074909EB|nr:hypothetical protein [Streptomyces sp. NRRL F-4489]KUL34961.1 hypothetical protein ADL22_29125 [Streptomyces sp. NRRL F-4489]
MGGFAAGERYEAGDAAAALARAAELGDTVRKGTRWSVRYQIVYGCAAGLMVLAIGLVKSPWGTAFGLAFWGAVVAGLSVYAARQPVARRGYGKRHAVLIASWGVLYGVVLAAGIAFFPGVAAWWVPGAVAVALPGLIGAYLEARR